LPNGGPVASVGRVFYLIQDPVNRPLESLAGYNGGMLTAVESGVYRIRWAELIKNIDLGRMPT